MWPHEKPFLFQPLPLAIEHWAYCTRCDPYDWIRLPEPKRFPTRHRHDIKRSTNDVS